MNVLLSGAVCLFALHVTKCYQSAVSSPCALSGANYYQVGCQRHNMKLLLSDTAG